MEGSRRLAGRYQLEERIGRGGMGVVWRAHDDLLDRPVAVKEVLYTALSDDDRAEFNRRTIREARAAGRLSHPNVIVVHDVIEEDGRPWIVMQLVRSTSLGDALRSHGPLVPDRVAAIGAQVLDALVTAHAAGILHRDVKPENVLLTPDNRVVLTDFGIASMTEDPSVTLTGSITGTPAFLPPERLSGHPATPESDLWSLGATLWAAVEGRSPFDRGTPIASMAAVLHEETPVSHRAGPLGPVLDGLMCKDPARRMGADEAMDLLHQAASGKWNPQGGQTRNPPQNGVPAPTPPEFTGGHGFGAPPPPANGHTPVGPYGPGQPTYTTPPPPEKDRDKFLIVTLATLLVALVGIGGYFAYTTLTANGDPGVVAGGLDPVTRPPSPEPTPEPTPTPTPTPDDAPPLPQGWSEYQDDRLRFAVALPPGWAPYRSEGQRVYFQGPGMQGYLQVDLTPWERDDPLEALEVVEQASTSKGLLRDYRRIAMKRTSLTVGGFAAPGADWEFVHTTSMGTWRVYDRAFRIDNQCYALYWQVPEQSWAKAAPWFRAFARTFRPI
ncbi:serine/threonine-protein kinase [Herbidospora daliensis]|uniref:serine/threonine-protein kinase n=1 Tax=Herbidospora daliensis TaxID=295585 RepID=UPI000B10A052|nr:serine/threonine-protein kinase [Herbidospora daliensis]